MNRDEASQALKERQDRDHEDCIDRFMELMELLPDQAVGTSGSAAHWLFEDVKGTWIYGFLSATVVLAAAFCKLQLAEMIRMGPDDPSLTAEPLSLEELARAAAERQVIGVELQAVLTELHDLSLPYLTVNLHRAQMLLDRHMVEAEDAGDNEPQITDGRRALRAAVAMLIK